MKYLIYLFIPAMCIFSKMTVRQVLVIHLTLITRLALVLSRPRPEGVLYNCKFFF